MESPAGDRRGEGRFGGLAHAWRSALGLPLFALPKAARNGPDAQRGSGRRPDATTTWARLSIQLQNSARRSSRQVQRCASILHFSALLSDQPIIFSVLAIIIGESLLTCLISLVST